MRSWGTQIPSCVESPLRLLVLLDCHFHPVQRMDEPQCGTTARLVCSKRRTMLHVVVMQVVDKAREHINEDVRTDVNMGTNHNYKS